MPFDGCFADRLENDVLQLVTNQACSGAALAGTHTTQTYYLGLLTTAPTGDDGAGIVEVGASLGYARISASGYWGAVSAGTVTNNAAAVSFGPATGAGWTITVKGLGIFKAGTRDVADLVVYCALAVPVTIANGSSLTIPIGALTIAMT